MERSSSRMIILLLSIASFIVPFMGSSINVALPSIGKELALDAYTLGWITLSFLLSTAALLVPMGRLADIRGRKKVFIIGCTIYSISSFLSAISNSDLMLIITRSLQGIGASMLFATGVAILASFFPAGERGKALGISTAATYIGLSAGPFIGGILTASIGWRSIFILNGIVSSILTISTAYFIKGEWAESRGEVFDKVGSILYVSMLTIGIYSISTPFEHTSILLMLTSFILLILFITWESRIEVPILNIKILKKNSTFTFSNIAALINYSATYAIGFLLSLYLQYIKGLDPQTTGSVLLMQPLVQASISPIAGKLSDRFDARLVASTGMLITAFGLLSLVYIEMSTSLYYIAMSLVLLGIGFGIFSSPNTNAIMGSIDRRFFGVASSLLGTMRVIGQMLSMAIATMNINFFIKGSQIVPDVYANFVRCISFTFTIFFAMCLLGVLASLAGSDSLKSFLRIKS